MLGLSNCCLQLYFSLLCYFTCCCLFFSWGSTVLWRYSCDSCLGPSAHIVSFALEAKYGRSPPCFNGRLLAGLLSSQEMQAAVWRAGKYAREGGGTGRKKSPLSTSSVTHLVCVCMSVYECLLMWICTLLSDGALKAIVHLKQQGPVGQSDPTMAYLFVEVYEILPHVNVLFSRVGFNWLMKYVFFFAVSLREESFILHTCLHVNFTHLFHDLPSARILWILTTTCFLLGITANVYIIQMLHKHSYSPSWGQQAALFFLFSFFCLLLCKSLSSALPECVTSF